MKWLLNTFIFACTLSVQVASAQMPSKVETVASQASSAWQPKMVEQLLQAIEHADEEGLNPDNPRYHRIQIEALKDADTLTPDNAAQLNQAFMSLAHDLFYGFAYESEANSIYYENGKKSLNLSSILNTALQQANIQDTLNQLIARHPYYQNLKKALTHYRNLAEQGGWNTEPESYQDLNQVRQRLMITGDYPSTPPEECQDSSTASNEAIESWCWELSPEDDLELEKAIKHFQRRHHLTVDGIVGKRTRNALAESIEQKIALIKINLERWRWYHALPERYVMVNIPGYCLKLVQKNRPDLNMKVVVGQEKRPTPMMEDSMRYLVLNPYWRIPKTILVEDILPKLKKDPEYLKRNKISLFRQTDADERHLLNPDSVDWQSQTQKSVLAYKFRQEPGELNPLGTIKFMFPNSEDIYIHDTSAQHLFKYRSLMYSSGCIRAEKPYQLAHQILDYEDAEISLPNLSERIVTGQREVIWLTQPVPVFLTYQTAWADKNGELHLHKDIYQYDDKLLSLLNKLEKPR
ncbi:L,D-transpeptidase family protein [Thiomicrorhabdus sp. zzn3]|uniref:L,D-transpeptidase family protein n=1 Tax=Thiomicrorhabdus sp. zzn3 TaxID=3039775 RepID=UPI002436808E|nr:L,D-transpeptidase family protein [Thiomicrorhabdus sp. zzn3]MDG6779082.1 L,D-transpeptidase family protein [Thiomicrorhabdus sp. zzn3]